MLNLEYYIERAYMKFAIAGSSGFVGKALVQKLRKDGHEVLRLVRENANLPADAIAWNPQSGVIDTGKLDSVDVVVNLAGENIADGLWTRKKKKRIWESRVVTTENLSAILVSLPNPPKVLINASAIGYYGDCGEKEIAEDSPPGSQFLARLCQEWEKATKSAENAGIRVVNLRIGMVLDSDGGALKKMSTLFKMCLGGVVGTGDQFISWITLQDLLSIVCFAVRDTRVKGPINAVSPEPVRNRKFTKALGKVLKRPTLCPLPAFIAKMVFGEMGEALLLEGARIYPLKLQKLGFNFEHKNIHEALQKLLS